ncbi:large ribosomal subunit protein mL49 [Monosporozyma unispora]|nr:hypothetical protein C6P44_003963 [Kazachstania unispora]
MSVIKNVVKNRSLSNLGGIRFHSHAVSHEANISLSNALFPKLTEVKQDDMIPLDNSVTTRGKYFVERSETGNLPVYTDYLGGGNKVVTEIKKIRGDPVQLKLDLQERLPYIDPQDWRVVAASNKIVVKGNYCSQIKKVLGNTF